MSSAIEQLEADPQGGSFVRTYAYPLGPAYGLLLDRWSPGWTRRIAAEDDLGALTMAAAGVEPDPDPDAAAARYAGSEMWAAEQAREAERQARVEELRRRFVDGPALIVPRARNASFMTTGVTPIPGAGTVLPTYRVTGDWGSLEADLVLVAPDQRTLRLAGPFTIEGAIISGAGWTLELAEGWTVREGPLPQDHRVVRRQ